MWWEIIARVIVRSMRAGALLSLFVLLLTGPALAGTDPGPDQLIVAGRLPCQVDWDGRSHGWRQLAWELMKRTSVEAELESRPVDPGQAMLFHTPLLFWSCPGPVATLDERQAAMLRRFLTLGGFLFIDDPSADPGGAFDRSVRAQLARLLPRRKLVPLPSDHVLFKTFFLIGRPAGRVQARPYLEGIEIDKRLVAVYSANDLLGAINRDLLGNWEFVVEPDGESQREASFRLGINLVFYALCLDYKNDRVHLPFILKRRRQ